MPDSAFDAAIIGGGFYGCSMALYLRGSGVGRVLILERDEDIMRRASYANQARVHTGYHYPRSLLTGLRSRLHLPRFSRDSADCTYHSFETYHDIWRVLAHLAPAHFRAFPHPRGSP